MMMMLKTTLLVAAALTLGACGERDQVNQSPVRKADVKASMGANNPYVAAGWKPGDAASWEEQINSRTQRGQNEYNRTAGTKP
jgi:hypothetical protein